MEKGGQGLNLTWEVRDGILNHQTSTMPHTLEGKIVRFSDKIAYIHHDIDDAVRGKIMVEEDIPIEIRKVLGKNSADRLDTLIHDIITNSMDKPDIIMSDEIFQAMQDLRKFMFVSVYTNSIAKGRRITQQTVYILYGTSDDDAGTVYRYDCGRRRGRKGSM